MFDAREVHKLARKLGAVQQARTVAAIVPVAHKAGVNMKSDLQGRARGHRRLGGLTAGIAYEVSVSPSEVRVEAGWLSPFRQGHLENIAVWGTSRTAPVIDIAAVMNREAPAFARHVSQVAAKGLLR